MIEFRTPDQPSVATLVGNILENTRHLLRQEINLIKTEVRIQLREALTSGSKGVALLAGGAVFGTIGLAFLGLTLILALSAVFAWALWISALIVTVIYFIVAGALALIGRSILQDVNIDIEPGVSPTVSSD